MITAPCNLLLHFPLLSYCLVQQFKLHDRAMHVYSEANRVYQFQAQCSDQSPSALDNLGQLMFESHQSCSQGYQCSCKELDELVALAR